MLIMYSKLKREPGAEIEHNNYDMYQDSHIPELP